MKPAQEWLDSTLLLSGSYWERIERIKQIQRDAIDASNEAAIKWFNNRPELTTVGLANAILSIKP